jgi:hypothetical protein
LGEAAVSSVRLQRDLRENRASDQSLFQNKVMLRRNCQKEIPQWGILKIIKTEGP